MSDRFSRRVIARTAAIKLFEGPAHRQHWVQVLAAYLVEHGHTHELDFVVNDIARVLYEERRYLRVDITTARPLNSNTRTAIERFLKTATGARDIELSEHIDPDLIGGLIAQTPDSQLDLSIRKKLKDLAAIA